MSGCRTNVKFPFLYAFLFHVLSFYGTSVLGYSWQISWYIAGCVIVLVFVFSCGATQYMVLRVRKSVLPVSFRCPVPRFTKLYSPNLCLGKSIVGNVVVWFVCFMSWSGFPHSFQKITLLRLKTTGLVLHTKCQPVCMSMSFILRNFSNQSLFFIFRLLGTGEGFWFWVSFSSMWQNFLFWCLTFSILCLLTNYSLLALRLDTY